MFGDIKRFMVLLGIVMLAFGLTFSGLASANLLLVTHSSLAADAGRVQHLSSSPPSTQPHPIAKLWCGLRGALNASCGAARAGGGMPPLPPSLPVPSPPSHGVSAMEQPMTSVSEGFLLALWGIHGEMIGNE
ncbi:MAG: hypothetical protein SGPRY_000746, partial [Prymnesium sp.]